MPFSNDGIYTPPNGAENAFPGQVIASATWNAIFTDIAAALTQLGEVTLYAPNIVTVAGSISVSTVGTNVTFLVINKAAPSATPVKLSAVSGRNGQVLRIKDWAGNGGDITITPAAGNTIEGLSSWTVGSGGVAGSGGSITLVPVTSLSGWAVVV